MASRRTDELLRQILANPDDLALRGVYADELQAAGDPRGEFIALELADDAPAHASRRASLLGAHAATWWPGLARDRLATRHGFLDRVACDAADLVAARAVFAREPVRDIELVDAHAATIPLAEPAWQAHAIRFAARGFLQEAVFELCASPLGDRLVALDVAACHLDRDIVPLGDTLPACRSLSLAANLYLGRHLPKLLDWEHLGALEQLDLSHTAITPELLVELLAKDLHSLRVLKLSGNPIGRTGARIVADALPRMPALAHVELFACELDELDAAPLRDRTQLARTVVTVADMPATLTIDLVGSTLELVRLGDDRWATKVDGRQRTIRWRQVQRDDRREARAGAWQMAEIAPLDRLGHALASGMPRELTADGCNVPRRAQTGYVYNSSVYTSETVHIACTPAAATVAITFDEYTSVD